jgi:hypothetical protein
MRKVNRTQFAEVFDPGTYYAVIEFNAKLANSYVMSTIRVVEADDGKKSAIISTRSWFQPAETPMDAINYAIETNTIDENIILLPNLVVAFQG